MAKGKKQAAPTKKKPTLAKRFKCPFCANGKCVGWDLRDGYGVKGRILIAGVFSSLSRAGCYACDFICAPFGGLLLCADNSLHSDASNCLTFRRINNANYL